MSYWEINNLMINEYVKSISGKPLTHSKDLVGEVVVSKVDKFNAYNSKAHFSVKIVLSGTENYRINRNSFKIDGNSFLVVNPNADIELMINEKETRGICLFPSVEIVKDIYRSKTSSELQLLDHPFDNSELPYFTEKKHGLKDNATGHFLASQIDEIYKSLDKNSEFNADQFYLALSECLIEDQVAIERLLKDLKIAKKSTKEELYRRVGEAKKYIEDNYSEKLNLDQVAGTACLSKYHFTRSFKSLYHLSPIQYVLQLRLNKAMELLDKDYSYSEVTDIVGFSDVKNLRRAIKMRKVA